MGFKYKIYISAIIALLLLPLYSRKEKAIVHCIKGTEIVERSGDMGSEKFCSLAGKTGKDAMHGNYVSWHTNGKKSAEGIFDPAISGAVSL